MSKILIAGDSTVATQLRCSPYSPILSYCGWGQMIDRILYPGIPVENYALSGLTLESFRSEGHFEKLKQSLISGDYVLIQFGHNDQKISHLKAGGGYKDELISYINDLREKGGIPVLITSVARNSWLADGCYNDLLLPYAETVLEVGEIYNVPTLDLHTISRNWIIELGLQGAKRYFYPGDYTHANDYGGYKWACMLGDLISLCMHKDINELKTMLLQKNQWPVFDAPLENADPKYGWLAPPVSNTDLNKWGEIEHSLQIIEALEIAMNVFNYFATTATNEQNPLAYRAAIENGYLLSDFGAIEDMYSNISAQKYRELLLLAASGRNKLTIAAKSLLPQELSDGTVSGRAAVDYALQLEQLATGSKELESGGSILRPKGS